MGITINAYEGAIINIYGFCSIQTPNEIDLNKCEIACNNTDNAKSGVKTLDDYSWEEISEIGKKGLARETFGNDAKKAIKLKNGEDLVIQIIGYNHDVDENGIAIPISFDFHIIPDIEKAMNEKSTNKGGWRDSNMRKYLNDEFFSLLPDDLQKVIKAAGKQSKIDGDDTPIITVDKLWLKSEQEIYGRKIYSPGGEGHQYEHYARENVSWAKEDSTGSTASWWLRSVRYNYSNDFCYVYYSGYANVYNANFSFGFAPGFAV